MTSLAQLLGEAVDLEMVQYSLVYQFGQGMGFRMVEMDAAVGTGAPLATLG